MTTTYRCPRCARHEGRKTRKGDGFCDYCNITFKITPDLKSKKEMK